MKNRDSSELKRQMQGRWLQALSDLAPSLHQAIAHLGDSVPCPVDGGTDGFRLFDAGDRHSTAETGGGVKHAYRVFPEGIDLLMWVNDWSFPETYDALMQWLGGSTVVPITRSVPKVRTEVEERGLRRWLNTMWNKAVHLDHPDAAPARQYFASRGILKAALCAKHLRFHPGLAYTDKQRIYFGDYPAILTLVENNDSQHVGIHRTYITTSGELIDLGEKNKPKKMTPPVRQHTKGRRVRLFTHTQGFLGIAEGLETALAVYQAKHIPTWPCISATNIATFVPPRGIHTVIHFVDKDRSRAGENAASRLKERLAPMGIHLINLVPPAPIPDRKKGVDWADMLSIDRSAFDVLDDVIAKAYFKTA